MMYVVSSLLSSSIRFLALLCVLSYLTINTSHFVICFCIIMSRQHLTLFERIVIFPAIGQLRHGFVTRTIVALGVHLICL